MKSTGELLVRMRRARAFEGAARATEMAVDFLVERVGFEEEVQRDSSESPLEANQCCQDAEAADAAAILGCSSIDITIVEQHREDGAKFTLRSASGNAAWGQPLGGLSQETLDLLGSDDACAGQAKEAGEINVDDQCEDLENTSDMFAGPELLAWHVRRARAMHGPRAASTYAAKLAKECEACGGPVRESCSGFQVGVGEAETLLSSSGGA